MNKYYVLTRAQMDKIKRNGQKGGGGLTSKAEAAHLPRIQELEKQIKDHLSKSVNVDPYIQYLHFTQMQKDLERSYDHMRAAEAQARLPLEPPSPPPEKDEISTEAPFHMLSYLKAAEPPAPFPEPIPAFVPVEKRRRKRRSKSIARAAPQTLIKRPHPQDPESDEDEPAKRRRRVLLSNTLSLSPRRNRKDGAPPEWSSLELMEREPLKKLKKDRKKLSARVR